MGQLRACAHGSTTDEDAALPLDVRDAAVQVRVLVGTGSAYLAHRPEPELLAPSDPRRDSRPAGGTGGSSHRLGRSDGVRRWRP